MGKIREFEMRGLLFRVIAVVLHILVSFFWDSSLLAAIITVSSAYLSLFTIYLRSPCLYDSKSHVKYNYQYYGYLRCELNESITIDYKNKIPLHHPK